MVCSALAAHHYFCALVPTVKLWLTARLNIVSVININTLCLHFFNTQFFRSCCHGLWHVLLDLLRSCWSWTFYLHQGGSVFTSISLFVSCIAENYSANFHKIRWKVGIWALTSDTVVDVSSIPTPSPQKFSIPHYISVSFNPIPPHLHEIHPYSHLHPH